MSTCGDATLDHTCTREAGHEGKHNDGRKEWGRLPSVKKSKGKPPPWANGSAKDKWYGKR